MPGSAADREFHRKDGLILVATSYSPVSRGKWRRNLRKTDRSKALISGARGVPDFGGWAKSKRQTVRFIDDPGQVKLILQERAPLHHPLHLQTRLLRFTDLQD